VERVNSPRKFVAGNTVLPFNPASYIEVDQLSVFYMSCHSQLPAHRAAAKLQATLIVSRRVCVSATSMLNILETKPFRGSCSIESI